MLDMKTTRKQTAIDTSKYINMETGETLDSEIPNITSVNRGTDYVIIESEEYFIVDMKALNYLESFLTPTQHGYVMLMARMIKGRYNLLYRKGQDEPHQKETLMKELELSRNIFANLVKTLKKHSVIATVNAIRDGKEVTLIMMNPTLSRRSKTVHKDCMAIFYDLTKIK